MKFSSVILSLAGAFLFIVPFASAQNIESSDPTITFEARITDIKNSTCDEDKHACMEVDLVGTTTQFTGKEIHAVIEPNDFLGHMTSLTKGDVLIMEAQMMNGEYRFIIADLSRRPILIWLLILFTIVALAVGGMATLRSVFGMGLSIILLFAVLLPQIMAGHSPLLVSVVGSFVIMTVTFLVTHGWNAKMWSALVGTAFSLAVTAVLAMLFTQWGRIFGLGDENVGFLLQTFPNLDTRGLLLAGIIIGTLGTLDDVTISQASSVFELKSANPPLTMRQLYQGAMRIGRDHIAGAVNTLVLAYAGASLSLLLLIATNAGQESWLTLISRESFASEIVRTFVGSLGLLAAIPATNYIACLFANRLPLSAVKKITEGHASHVH
jgi:uncharacterized membrane protein